MIHSPLKINANIVNNSILTSLFITKENVMQLFHDFSWWYTDVIIDFPRLHLFIFAKGA
jgi:hypothetical protein